MGTSRILVLGGANLDTVATAIAIATNAPRHGDSMPGRVRASPGGVARNVAENLARLGHAVALVSAVGDDPAGRALLAATRQAGVDVSACPVLPGEATASYVAVHDADGHLIAAVNDMQVLERLDGPLLAQHAPAVDAAAAWVIDANLCDAALAWLLAQRARSARHATTPVFADAVSAAKCVRLQPWLGHLHTLKVNRLEARALCGFPVDAPHEVQAAARWLHSQGVAHVVISLGAQGLYFSARTGGGFGAGAHPDAMQPAEAGWLPALPGPVLNTNGAGDALMAGLVHSHVAQATLPGAARFAAACAALTVAAPSANHPDLSPALVAQWLDSHTTT